LATIAATQPANTTAGAVFHMTAMSIAAPSSIDVVVRRHCVYSVAI
jgi:hypothetical protein